MINIPESLADRKMQTQPFQRLSDPDFEPSDEELETIMSDAMAGVAQRAMEAGIVLQERLAKAIHENTGQACQVRSPNRL